MKDERTAHWAPLMRVALSSGTHALPEATENDER